MCTESGANRLRWEGDGAGKLTPSPGYTEVCPPSILRVTKCGCKKACRTLSCDCKKVSTTCNDFCLCGDHCENQPNEAPEPIGVSSSSDPDDLEHDDFDDASCPDESDAYFRLED